MKLKYKDKCPGNINSTSRNGIIKQFLDWKGMSYVLKHIHSAIRWNKSNPFHMTDTIRSPWQIIQHPTQKKINTNKAKIQNTSNFIPAQGSVPTLIDSINNKKWKSMIEDNIDMYSIKKVKHIHDIPKGNQPNITDRKNQQNDDENVNSSPLEKVQTSRNVHIIPKGFIWDPDNYSCAYDAIFTILHSIWMTEPQKWKEKLELINNMMKPGFEQESIHQLTLEHVRNNIRHILHKRDPEMFLYNHIGTDIHDLVNILFQTDDVVTSCHYKCIICKHIINIERNTKSSLIYYGNNTFTGTTADYLYSLLTNDI
jgi:hypothetical protein